MELVEIGDVFSISGVSYIPLKGSVVKKYYPYTDMRRSSDIEEKILSMYAKGMTTLLHL